MEDLRRQEVRELARMTAHLDPAQQIFFQTEYGRHRRNPTTALLLCVLLGGFGAHYFYFGRHRAGMTRLLLCWTLIPAVLALFDAHTMTARTMRYNASLANELLLAVKGAVDEDAAQARQVIASRPQPRLHAEDLAAIAAPAASEPTGRVLMDSTWARPEPLAEDVAAPVEHAAFAPVVAAAVGGGAAVAGYALGSGWSRMADAHHEEPDGAAPFAQPADALAAPSSAPSADYVPEWPNAMARPVWPVEPVQMSAPETEQAVWPVPAALLAASGDTAATPDDIATPGEPYARYARAERPADTDTSAFDGNIWEPFAPESPVVATTAAGTAYAATAYGERFGPEQEAPAAASFAYPTPLDDPTPYGEGPAEESVLPQDRPEPVTEPAAAQPVDEREPVLMYQVAAPRRESVHMEPPPAETSQPDTAAADDIAFPWAARLPVTSSGRSPAPAGEARTGEHAAISAIGSALAFGLADLLRERTRPTRPITRPRTAETMPMYDLPRQPLTDATPPAEPPSAQSLPPWLLDSSAPAVDEATQPVAQAAPEPLPSWWSPKSDSEPALAASPIGAGADAHTALEAGVLAGAGGLAGAAAYRAFAAHEAEQAPLSALAAEPVAVATPAPVAPASPPSIRRRVVQRVIVRKMAVLDGQVVAESSVERQVPVVADDHEMGLRIQQATTDASREALNYLLMQAPEEARPSIRQQLYDLRASLN